MQTLKGLHMLLNDLENQIKEKDELIKQLNLDIKLQEKKFKKEVKQINYEVNELIKTMRELVEKVNLFHLEKLKYQLEVEKLNKTIPHLVDNECKKRINDIIKFYYLTPKNIY